MRGLLLLLLLAGCHLPDTHSGPDAGLEVHYQLGVTSRYQDPLRALAGLTIWLDGENRELDASVLVQEGFPNMGLAADSSHVVDVRHGETILDTVVQRPGNACTHERGDGNRLLTETVNLCVRANGEIQLNDFSCEYEHSGYFTADVFCPTVCHPILGGATCQDSRCGLLLTKLSPRYGKLACIAEGDQGLGASCRSPGVGEVDDCIAGLACVAGACRAFCVTGADCPVGESCLSALSNDAEPRVCIDPAAAPRDEVSR